MNAENKKLLTSRQRRLSSLSKNIYLQAQNHLYIRGFSNQSYFNVLDID